MRLAAHPEALSAAKVLPEVAQQTSVALSTALNIRFRAASTAYLVESRVMLSKICSICRGSCASDAIEITDLKMQGQSENDVIAPARGQQVCRRAGIAASHYINRSAGKGVALTAGVMAR